MSSAKNYSLSCDSFFDLTLGARWWTSGAFGLGALVLAVVVALIVHCCHRRASERARQLRNGGGPRDEEAAASRAQVEAQVVALQAAAGELEHELAGSHARAAELERELAASRAAADSLQEQVAAAEQKARQVYGDGMQRIQILERRLAAVEEARDLEAEAHRTSYALFLEASGEVERLHRLLDELLGVKPASLAQVSLRAPPSAARASAPHGEPSAADAPRAPRGGSFEPGTGSAPRGEAEPPRALRGEPSGPGTSGGSSSPGTSAPPGEAEPSRAPRGVPSAPGTSSAPAAEAEALRAPRDVSSAAPGTSASAPPAMAMPPVVNAAVQLQQAPPLQPAGPDEDVDESDYEYYSAS